MRKISLILSLALIISAVGIVPVSATPTNVTTLFSEDFEGQMPTEFFKVSGNSIATTAENVVSADNMGAEDVVGFGTELHRFGSTSISAAFLNGEKVYLLNDASDYAANKEGAHTYVETEFDVYVTNAGTAQYNVMLTSDLGSAPSDSFLAIRFDTDGKIKLIAKETKRTGSAAAYELCGFENKKGNAYRIKVVMHVTDDTDTTCEKILAVYVNGENKLSAPKYFTSHNTGKFAYFNRIKISGWTMGLDNITVTQYQSATGELLPDKGKLIAMLRKAQKHINSGFTEDEMAVLNQSFAECEAVYEDPSATQAEIEEKITTLNEICAVVAKPAYIVNDNFEGTSQKPLVATGADSTDMEGATPFIGGKALRVTGGLLTANAFQALNVMEKKTNSIIEFDFCLNNIIGTTNDVKMVFNWKDNQDVSTKITQLYFNKGSSGVMQLQYPNAEVKNLNTEVNLENDKWYNLKFIIHAIEGTPGENNRPKVSIYLDGIKIADKLFTQSYNAAKCLYFDLFEIETKADSGILIDNIEMYELEDGAQPPMVYGKAKRTAWDSYTALKNAVKGEGETEYYFEDVDALNVAYQEALTTFEEAITQAVLDAATDGLQTVLSSFKPNGKSVALKEATGSISNNQANIAVTVRSSRFAQSSNEIYVIAAPMLKNEDNTFSSQKPEVKRISLGRNTEVPDNITIDLSGYTDAQKTSLYVSVFAVSNLAHPVVLGDVINVLNDADVTPQEITWGKETVDGLAVNREYVNSDFHLIARTTSQPGEKIAILVYEETTSEVGFAEVKTADENGRCEFTIKTDKGEYTLSESGGKSKAVAYANAAETNTMLAEVNLDKTKFQGYSPYFDVDKTRVDTASAKGMDVEEAVEKLFETTYTSETLNLLAKEANKVFENLISIADAQNVDTINSAVVGLSNYLENYSLFSSLSDGKKREAGAVILRNKAGINGITSLDTAIFNAKNEVGNTPSGGSVGGGAGGGGIVGGSSDLKITGVEVPESQTQTPAEEREKSFSDVKTDHWAHEAVSVFAAMGYVSGDGNGNFAPDRAITREEFVKIAIEVFNLKKASDNSGFADVDRNAWYNDYVCAAVENGIINGYDNGTFGIGNSLSREDLAVIVYRLAENQNIGMTEGGIYIEFDDEELISDYAFNAVKELSSSAIINGVGENRFAPKETCTRAEAIKMIYELWRLK